RRLVQRPESCPGSCQSERSSRSTPESEAQPWQLEQPGGLVSSATYTEHSPKAPCEELRIRFAYSTELTVYFDPLCTAPVFKLSIVHSLLRHCFTFPSRQVSP